ncbi:MAG: hypothetical protein KC800_21175 [Candidatus Eremiobacteraeota bacterium]|nr:hypothetical protein [Candidatus Eremiobacteraeota bacterium]
MNRSRRLRLANLANVLVGFILAAILTRASVLKRPVTEPVAGGPGYAAHNRLQDSDDFRRSSAWEADDGIGGCAGGFHDYLLKPQPGCYCSSCKGVRYPGIRGMTPGPR